MGQVLQRVSSYWRRVGFVLAWQVAASMCYYAVYAAAPFLRDEFGLSRFTVGIVLAVLTLGYAVFLLPIGALTDRHGERLTLTVGLGGLAAGVALVAAAPTYPALLVATFVLGSFYGTAMPGTNKAIYDHIKPGRQNLAVGIKQVGVTAGSGASALLVTGISGFLFWQSGLLLTAVVALGVTSLFFASYPDAGGGQASARDFGALAANRPYRALVVAGLFLGAAIYTTVGYTVLYVDESVGTTVVFGGVVLALIQVSGSAGRVVTGWLGDVLPGDPQIRIGLVLLGQAVASAGLFVALPFATRPALAAVAFVAIGFFLLGLTGIYYSCMATLVGPGEIGGATAGGQLAITTGGLLVPPAFGYLADTFGYGAGWWLLAVCCAIAALLVGQVVRTESPVGKTAMSE